MNHPTIHQSAQFAAFNEEQWLEILYQAKAAQQQLKQLQKKLFQQLIITGNTKLRSKKYYLTASALAHILERHYYKLQRFPGAGQFIILIPEILQCIRDAYIIQPTALRKHHNPQRTMKLEKTIGFDRLGQPTQWLTVISDPCGRILTAYPGTIQ